MNMKTNNKSKYNIFADIPSASQRILKDQNLSGAVGRNHKW